MNNEKLIYDSSEISSIVSKIKENIDCVETDVKASILKDFTLLQELDFFNDGLIKLEKESDSIISLYSNLVSKINEHDVVMNDIVKKQIIDIESFKNNLRFNNSNNNYNYDVKTTATYAITKINDAKVILSKYTNEVIPSFSYNRKLEILKNILKSDPATIMTDKGKSDILIYNLKNILSKNYSIELSKLSKEEEEEVQRNFFESISDNDTNIFDEIGENTLLSGLPYYKQIARKSDISIGDLLFDKKNEELFLKSLMEVYESEEIDVLTNKELNSVKNYINNISKENNISVKDLLSNTKYSSIVKGGINYEN